MLSLAPSPPSTGGRAVPLNSPARRLVAHHARRLLSPAPPASSPEFRSHLRSQSVEHSERRRLVLIGLAAIAAIVAWILLVVTHRLYETARRRIHLHYDISSTTSGLVRPVLQPRATEADHRRHLANKPIGRTTQVVQRLESGARRTHAMRHESHAVRRTCRRDARLRHRRPPHRRTGPSTASRGRAAEPPSRRSSTLPVVTWCSQPATRSSRRSSSQAPQQSPGHPPAVRRCSTTSTPAPASTPVGH